MSSSDEISSWMKHQMLIQIFTRIISQLIIRWSLLCSLSLCFGLYQQGKPKSSENSFFSASNSFNYLHSTSKLFLLDGNLKRKGFIKFIGNNGELTSASAMSFLSQKRRKCVSEFVMRAERPFDTSPSLCWCGKVPNRFLKIELSCTVVISIR